MSAVARKRRPSGDADALGTAPPAAGTTRAPANDLRDEILVHGLNASRATALADALEAEGRLVEALDALVLANRLRRDAGVERRLVRLRRAACAQLDHSFAPSRWPHFALEDEPGVGQGPIEIAAAEFSPAALRAGILRHGHLLVRGLVPRERAARLRDAVEQTFRAHELIPTLGSTPELVPWCDPLEDLPEAAIHRVAVHGTYGVLAADSPRALCEFLETLRDLRLIDLIGAYLGERPGLLAKKCTLRRVDASDPKLWDAAWHQDGAFLGRGIRTLNTWVALSTCGRDAPGMELMPIRLQRLLPGGESGAPADWTVASHTVKRELPGVAVWRPEFHAGDVLFFDHWSLHRTAADEGMPNVRYAIESWFAAPSTYPEDASTILLV